MSYLSYKHFPLSYPLSSTYRPRTLIWHRKYEGVISPIVLTIDSGDSYYSQDRDCVLLYTAINEMVVSGESFIVVDLEYREVNSIDFIVDE